MGRLPRLAALAAALSIASPAAAQQPEAEQSECRPACRSGFTCVDGTCVSECNPPCPDGQVCTDGECLAPAAAAPSTAAAPPAGAPPTAPPPSFGPSASAAGQGNGGWVQSTGSGPPSAPGPGGDAWRAERRRIRRLLHLVGYVGLGMAHYFHLPSDDGVSIHGENGEALLGFHANVGFGFRWNFSYVVGVQARLSLGLTPALSAGIAEGPFCDSSDGCESVSALSVGVGADVTFRVGPFAQAFPMYLGIGGWLSGQSLSASGDTLDYGGFWLGGGGTAELGFVFGGQENLDLGVRASAGPTSPITGLLTFGYSFSTLEM